MAPARPLHELLAGLTGDAARASGDREAYLAANGHPDLPDDLVAEAVVSYADTAPVEVAEHLAPYVTAHSAVPTGEPTPEDWFTLLATTPTDPAPAPEPDPTFPEDPGPTLDFGTGAPATPEPSTVDDIMAPPTELPQPSDDPTPASTWPDLEPEPLDLDSPPEPDTSDPDDPDDPDDPA